MLAFGTCKSRITLHAAHFRVVDSAAPAMTTPAAAPVAAPTSVNESTDPYLAKLESGYRSRLESEVLQPFAAAVQALNQSYIKNGLARARATAQAKGNLAEITALDEEKAMLEKGGAVPETDATDTTESLKNLRATYRAALGKHTSERDAKTAPLLTIYVRALDAHIAELTKAGKIEQARQVQALRDTKAATLKPLAETTPKSEPQTVPAVMTKPDVTENTGGKSPQRQLAEWLVMNGGHIKVPAGNGRIEIKTLADLPAGKLELAEIFFPAEAVTDTAHNLLRAARDVEIIHISGAKTINLQFLTELRKLGTLGLTSKTIGEAGWSVLGSLKDLKGLNLDGAVTDDELARLNGLASLQRLVMEYAPKGTGFSGMKASRKLVELNLGDNGSTITDEGLVAIASTFPALQILCVAAWDHPCAVTNEGLKVLLPLKSLTGLGITGKAVDDGSLETLIKMRGLKLMFIRGTAITPEGCARLRAAMPGCKIEY
jgi:hypothetical protein